MQTLLVNSLQNFDVPLHHDQEPVNPGSAHNPNSDPTAERWTGDDLPSIGQMITGAFEEPLRLQIAPVDPPQGGDGRSPGRCTTRTRTRSDSVTSTEQPGGCAAKDRSLGSGRPGFPPWKSLSRFLCPRRR